jgi:hypothetical protein
MPLFRSGSQEFKFVCFILQILWCAYVSLVFYGHAPKIQILDKNP